MKSVKKMLAFMMLLSTCILFPNTLVYAQRNQDPVTIPCAPAEFYDYSVMMPNGFMQVNWKIKFLWYYEGEEIGYAWQYVTGIQRTDGVAMLRGYGVFTSTLSELPGTLTYTIGNNWDTTTGEIWAFRMRIVGGTDSYEGIKGTGTAEAFPDFLLYLNFNPWD